MTKNKNKKVELPEKVIHLINSADACGASVMFFDQNNDAIYSNHIAKCIYPIVDDNFNYEDLFWLCFNKNLLDDPEMYVDPHMWLSRALDYRRRTQFAQYIIRHNTGRILLARHQVFPGVGVFAGRLDITNEFNKQLTGYSSDGAFWDPVTGGTVTINRHNEPCLASAILSPGATFGECDLISWCYNNFSKFSNDEHLGSPRWTSASRR
jgi:hypothetical protein